ncbi:MAG: TRAP transporter substrate-binding protein [Rhodospirillales bacterium]
MIQRPLLPTPRRRLLQTAGGLAGILALGQAPVFAQAQPKKLVLPSITPPPEASGVMLKWMADEITARSKGELQVDFFGGTLMTKEIDVMNAVKGGNAAIGTPSGAASTIFPEMGVFLVPYLVQNYPHAYKILNGAAGDKLDAIFQQKYGVKVLFFFDLGFRHFWNSKRPIVEPKDLRGMKLRTQPSKVFTDTVNGLGAVAVPLGWAEVITAAQQGVIDGADLPVVNMVPLKAYEVSKYYSLTAHNYGSTVTVMNLAVWNGLNPAQQKMVLDIARETQIRSRQAMESVDSEASAKAQLEPVGMTVNAPNREPFRKLAMEKVWPAYQKQYPELWDQIVSVTA